MLVDSVPYFTLCIVFAFVHAFLNETDQDRMPLGHS